MVVFADILAPVREESPLALDAGSRRGLERGEGDDGCHGITRAGVRRSQVQTGLDLEFQMTEVLLEVAALNVTFRIAGTSQ
jgi:hypothetical protein